MDAPWTLYVLGRATLECGDTYLEQGRKTAALLSYLTLAGATSRARLAGLLWPDSASRDARNNLVQSLRRLKQKTACDLIVTGEQLRLADTLTADITALNLRALQGQAPGVLAFSGELLPFDYDDLPEFDAWLAVEREQLASLRRDALKQLIAAHEEAGDYAGAIGPARTLLAADPLAETSYRLLMRLHYLAGERSEGLEVVARCEAMLRHEFGLEPLPETLEVADALRKSLPQPRHAHPLERATPLSILRPPVLIGRETLWQALEAAWPSGQTVCLQGEAGSGKSRLMQDFLARKGDYHHIACRPGDDAVPLAVVARTLKPLLERPLEPWLRRELSRLLPQLGAEPPPPIIHEADRGRFFEALAEGLTHLRPTACAVVWDDFHHADRATFDFARYLTHRVPSQRAASDGASRAPTIFYLFRPAELPEAARQYLENDLQLKLPPFFDHEIEQLLASLELPHLPRPTRAALASALGRYTGGNPLFVLETLKHLLEQGHVWSDVPERLPQSRKVLALIGKRLYALSPGALTVARAAAVAGADFTQLSSAFAELERGQILLGSSFAHDLMLEATRAGLPTLMRRLLHKRTARWLEGAGAPSARIAQHYLAAGAENKALPHVRQAADEAKARYHFPEAADTLYTLGTLLERQGRSDEAFTAWADRTELLIRSGSEAAARALEALDTPLLTPVQRCRLLDLRCSHLTLSGDAHQLAAAARAGLALTEAQPEVDALDAARATFSFHLGHACWLQNRPAAALAHLEYAFDRQHAQGDPDSLAETTRILGGVLFELGRFDEAETMLSAAEQAYLQTGHPHERANILNERAINALKRGYPLTATPLLLEAHTIFSDMTGAGYDHVDVLHALAVCWALRAQETRCPELLEQAQALSSATTTGFGGALHLTLGAFYVRMGAFIQAEASFRRALEWPGLPSYHRPAALRHLAGVYAKTERSPHPLLTEAEALTREAGNPVQDICALLSLKAQLSKAEDALEYAREASRRAHAHGFRGDALLALIRLAQVLLRYGRTSEAQEASNQAGLLLEDTGILSLHAEHHLTLYRAQRALGDPLAQRTLKRALDGLEQVTRDVPAIYHEGFLRRNPVNRALLDEAAQRGLEPSPL